MGAVLVAGCSGPAPQKGGNDRVQPEYDRSGRLTKLSYDRSGDGKPETWGYIDGARLMRVEADEDGRFAWALHVEHLHLDDGSDDAAKALAPMLWLLASESRDGRIDTTVDHLAFRLRTDRERIDSGLRPLIEAGFVACLQGADAESEGETETESESEPQGQKGPEAGASASPQTRSRRCLGAAGARTSRARSPQPPQAWLIW